MKNKQCVFFLGSIFMSVFAMQEPKQKFPIARRKSIRIIFKNGEPVIEDNEPIVKSKCLQKKESSWRVNDVQSSEKSFLFSYQLLAVGNEKSNRACDCCTLW